MNMTSMARHTLHNLHIGERTAAYNVIAMSICTSMVLHTVCCMSCIYAAHTVCSAIGGGARKVQEPHKGF